MIYVNSIWSYNSDGPCTIYLGCNGVNSMRPIKHKANEINEYYDKGSEILPSNNDERVYKLIEIEIYKIMIE